MKKDIHPNYRPVIFLDSTANFSFLTRSTVKTNDKMKFIDTTGRVEKFQKKYGWDKRQKKDEKSGEK